MGVENRQLFFGGKNKRETRRFLRNIHSGQVRKKKEDKKVIFSSETVLDL